MKRISVERAFLAARGFVAGEWRLLVPVALAFLALPSLAVDLLVPESDRVIVMQATASDPVPAALARMMPITLAVMLMAVLGGLVISALALVPGISVREAIVTALRRLPAQLAASLLFGAALLAGAVAVAVAGLMAGLPIEAVREVLALLIVIASLALSVKLAAVMPLLIDRRLGPWQAIRTSWTMTRGAFGRLFAAIAVYVVGAAVVVIAIGKALGGVLLLAGYALGQPEIARALAAVIDAGARGAMTAGLSILLVALYRELGRASSGT